MTYILKNNYLTAQFKAEGAELVKLVDKEGIDYLWNGDERYWKRHAPILFPIVGQVTHNTYSACGKDYSLGQHGFARDQTFEVTTQTDCSITFTLTSNALTKTLYPFDFRLDLTYTLDKNALAVNYKVTNIDTQTIGFKIGAHPAFMCPILQDEVMEDYYLEFEKEEDTNIMQLNKDGFFNRETIPFKGTKIALSPSTFAKGALAFSTINSQSIALCSHKNAHKLTVDFAGFTHLGLWSLATGAPFVCIEPWFGHADFEDEAKDLMLKEDLTTLKPNQVFTCTHTIRID